MPKTIIKYTQKFVALSINYEKAQTDIRGKYSFFSNQIVEFSKQIQNTSTNNCFIISTCNRTEIYAITDNIDELIEVFCQFVEGNSIEFKNYIEIYIGKSAVHHLFRVSSGLESQILGDFEIVGQLKTWFSKFKNAGITNSYLEKIVTTAIQISKKIKHQTGLSNGAASVSFAAVNYILKNVENCSDKNIVLLGMGKIGQNTCENLIKHTDNKHITIVNRTPEKAVKLAEKLLVQHKDIEELQTILPQADILIVATNANKPLITKAMLHDNSGMLIIDLSIPENVSEEVRSLKNITLLNVDELSKLIDENLEQRKLEIPKAEKIISDTTKEFENWEENRKFAPIISSFKNDLLRLNDTNYKMVKKNIPTLNGKENILSEKLAQKITNRFADFLLSNPEKAEETAILMKEIFHLD